MSRPSTSMSIRMFNGAHGQNFRKFAALNTRYRIPLFFNGLLGSGFGEPVIICQIVCTLNIESTVLDKQTIVVFGIMI